MNLGVLQFNRGFEKTYLDVFDKLNVTVANITQKVWEDIDKERIRQSNYKTRSNVKSRRKKRKQRSRT